jgi:hypothetical protein
MRGSVYASVASGGGLQLEQVAGAFGALDPDGDGFVLGARVAESTGRRGRRRTQRFARFRARWRRFRAWCRCFRAAELLALVRLQDRLRRQRLRPRLPDLWLALRVQRAFLCASAVPSQPDMARSAPSITAQRKMAGFRPPRSQWRGRTPP